MLIASDLKITLDDLALQYETKEFIKDDPVQFCHIFKNKADIEIAGFLAALFAFGKREVFIKKLNELLNIMEMKPLDFVLNYDFKAGLNGANYRFIREGDLVTFFLQLRRLYLNSSLEELFAAAFKEESETFFALQKVCDYFYDTKNVTEGYKFMLSNPKNKGAMKRMNMFLRWMIRKNSPVDIGLWGFLDQSKLLIPLDVHVGKISRSLGLIQRKQNDFKTVIELTEKLKEFNPNDPVKYDFALFGYGVNNK